MKVVVYTAIMVNNPESDKPIDLPCDFDLISGWDYVLLTNIKNGKQVFHNSGWRKGEIREIDPPENDMPIKSRRGWQIYAARWCKWHPDYFFSDYDFVIWVDGWQVPDFNKKDNWYFIIKDMFNKYNNNDPKTPLIVNDIHKKNKCIYEEHDAIVFCHKDTNVNMLKVSKYVKTMGYPKDLGLFWTGCYIYKTNSKLIQQVFKNLWEDMLLYTYRDQALLMFEIWRNKSLNNWGNAPLNNLIKAVDTDGNHGGYL